MAAWFEPIRTIMIVRAGILYDGTLEPPKRNVDLIISDGRVEADGGKGPAL